MRGLFSRRRNAAAVLVRPNNTLKTAAGAVVESLELRTLLSAGDPVGSPIFTDFGPGNTESGGQVLALANGQFLQVGTTFSSGTQFALALYNADGSPDNNFGPDGDGSNQATADLPTDFTDGVGDLYFLSAINAVAVNPTTGQIVVAGIADNGTQGNNDFLVAVFTSDGALDTSFGTGGVVISNFTTTYNEEFDITLQMPNEAHAVAIQNDGKIVVAGTDVSSGSFPGFAVARYTTSGALDGSFGPGGVVQNYFGFDFEDKANGVAIDATGNIYVAGTSRDSLNFSDIGPHIAVRKYNSSGVPIDSVRENYLSATPIFGDIAYAVAVDGNNKIIVAGNTDSPELANAQDFLLIRYDSNLDRDGTFGTSGVSTTGFGDISPFWSPAALNDLAIQSDGKIVVGGSVITCNSSDCGDVVSSNFVVGRYSAAGMTAGDLDASFGGTGLVLYSNGELFFPDQNLVTIGIQNDSTNDNQNVAFGSWVQNDGSQDFVLGRYDLAAAAAGTGGTTNVSISGPASTSEGSTVTFGGSVTSGGGGSGTAWFQHQHRAGPSTGGGTITSVSIDWGDGTPAQNVPVVAGNYSANHTYVDDNPTGTASDIYNVTVTAGTATDSQNITVNNAAPSVAPISGNANGVRNFTQTFSSSFSDPGTADTWTVTWDFGDSNSTVSSGSPGALSASHVYTANGSYTVTLTVADDDSGSNNRTFNVSISSAGVVGGTLQVGGSGGSDDITIKPSGGGTNVDQNGNSSNFSGFSQIVVMGGNGNDTVKVNPGVTQSVVVFGGAGDDSIKGGSGADILIGGDGNDLLQGQDGRDVLIGGDGQDHIVGQTDDDILVAGYSNYDSDLSALNSILAEWTSSRSYGLRSANIIGHNITIGSTTYVFGGTRSNGSTFLTPYDSSAPSASATVFDDADVDVLTGSSGQDLFLFNADNPVQDTITDLSSSEFAADIDFLTMVP